MTIARGWKWLYALDLYALEPKLTASTQTLLLLLKVALPSPIHQCPADAQKRRRVLQDHRLWPNGPCHSDIVAPDPLLPLLNSRVYRRGVRDPSRRRCTRDELALTAVALHQRHPGFWQRCSKRQSWKPRAGPDIDNAARRSHDRLIERDERIGQMCVNRLAWLGDGARRQLVCRKALQ